MAYSPLYDPENPSAVPELPPRAEDRRRAPVYDYDDDVKLAVNVALATGRPLLLRGDPGTGKSSLARHVAATLGWRYYQEVITSRTRARDLLWRFDNLRRLQEAQVERADTKEREAALAPWRFVEPGVLWWALNAETAAHRGFDEDDRSEDLDRLEDPAEVFAPAQEDPGDVARAADRKRAVVLLDEIDKADPDVPNNLLAVLGAHEFTVTETGRTVRGEGEPLVFITTNAERELPQAFLRRCVVQTLALPNRERMLKIGRLHFPIDTFKRLTDAVLEAVYDRLVTLGDAAEDRLERRPSTAEYLDGLRACEVLEVTHDDPQWERITAATMWKSTGPVPGGDGGGESGE